MWNVYLWRKDILQVLFQCGSGDSAATVLIVDWSTEDPSKIFGGVKDICHLQSVQTDSGPTQPPIKWLLGVLNPRGKEAVAWS